MKRSCSTTERLNVYFSFVVLKSESMRKVGVFEVKLIVGLSAERLNNRSIYDYPVVDTNIRRV